ncbi:hypothetical protein O6H91_06G017500 [Diphasiastrum complanatum]|uniref:Uncharacterized protein n=1 Tax=Diphasiastrum complanatum TaxID=34168 RepID=A0ACC2DBY2_DIPCM|nr:hypothetical protein O6H91_06G017500 [Diphasiastrum complanatum]
MQPGYSQSPGPGERDWLWPPLPPNPPNSDSGSNSRINNKAASAVSFGFIATAILIFVFLMIAVVERLLRPLNTLRSTEMETAQFRGQSSHTDKPDDQESEIDYDKGVSVVMPGQNIPTYFARPDPYPGLQMHLNQPL